MIFWTIKQLLSLKKAFTGRANPQELAWGLALGIAIGLIPKGNLVSISLIGLLVCLRVNHGMAALAAVATSFIAFRFDPWTHQLGSEILQAPRTHAFLTGIWDKPLVPWTDLNNTVVLGSTVVGLTSIVPTFMISLPLFRWLAPRESEQREMNPPPSAALALEAPAPSSETTKLQVVGLASDENSSSKIGDTQKQVNATIESRRNVTPDNHAGTEQKTAAQQVTPESNVAPEARKASRPHVETQIEIIRMKPKDDSDFEADKDDDDKNGPMNEALGYLLRRLRDSRQGKAA